MIARLLLCFSLGLVLTHRAWASNDCEDRLKGPNDDVLSRLQALPPYLLDYQNLQDSIEKLMASADQLRAPYQTLKRIEQALKQGNIEPSAAYNMADALTNYVRKESQRRLDGDTYSENARRVLEGDRILLNRLQKLQQRAIDQALREQEQQEQQEQQEHSSEENREQQNSHEPSDQDQQNQDQQNQDQQNQDQQKQDQQKQDQQKQDQQKQDQQKQDQQKQDQQKQDQQKQDQQKQDQQKQDQQKQDQQKQKQQKKDRFSNEDLAKEMERQLSEQLKRESRPEDVQNQSEEDFKDLDQKAAEKALEKKLQEQAKDSQKSQEGETADKECDGKETDKDSQCKTQKEIQDRLDKNFAEAKEKAKQKKAQDKGQEKSKKKGKQKGEKSEEKGAQPSQESADQSGDQSEGESQDDQGQRQNSQSKTHDQVSHSNQAGGQGAGKEGTGAKEFFDNFNQSLKEGASDDPTKDHSKITQEDLDREKREKKFDRQLKTLPKEDQLTPPDQTVQLELEKLLHTTWSHLLTQYSNSENFLRQLGDFASICNSLSVTTPGAAHFVKNYAARANTLAEQLRQTEVSYRDLSELALTFSGGVVKDQTLRRARYLERLLSSKEQEVGLRDAEEKTLQLVRALLEASAKNNDPVTAKTLAEALRDQLLGPLSRRALDQQYPSTNPLDELDYSAVERALKNGTLNDLVKFKRMAPLVNILVNDVFKPKFFERYEGSFGPINESDTVIERADDFEDIPHIIREGNPSQLEILRLLAGDMLKNAYREKVTKSDPRKPIPKRASIVLYDISGSMSNGGRDQLRNAIISAFVDQSQTDVARGSGEHTLYLVPFDGKPHEPRRIANLAEAQQVFDDMRARPLKSGGSTSITAALVKAYDMIADHQNNGGDLERANILLLTDGDDSLNLHAIEAARAKVDPKVDLALNAITIGEWNQHLCDMVKKYGINGDGEIGKVSHQHIPLDEIPKLLNPAAAVKDIIDTASDYDVMRNRRIPAVVLDRVRSSVMSMAGSIDSEEGMHATRADRWVRHIEALKTSHPEAVFEPQAQLFLELVARNVGKEWATAAKVQAFEDFIALMEEKSGLEAPQILLGFNPQTREILAKWLR